jgi:hypothetical protein
MSQRITCSFCDSIAKPTETECATCGAPLPIGVGSTDPATATEPADGGETEPGSADR